MRGYKDGKGFLPRGTATCSNQMQSLINTAPDGQNGLDKLGRVFGWKKQETHAHKTWRKARYRSNLRPRHRKAWGRHASLPCPKPKGMCNDPGQANMALGIRPSWRRLAWNTAVLRITPQDTSIGCRLFSIGLGSMVRGPGAGT